jgi:MFS transporter, DHA1 family, multidrug resistance protein
LRPVRYCRTLLTTGDNASFGWDVEGDISGGMVTWRRTLYALWLAQLFSVIGFSLRTPYLPFFLEELGTETFEQQALWAGFITGGGSALMAITAPMWGALADRYGRKMMVLRAMFIASLTVSLMALATSPWHLLGLRFVEGAMTGTVAAATTLIATVVPKERMGYAMGMMQMAMFSGSSIGPFVGGVLADLIGFRAAFVAAGSMLFLGGVIVLFFVTEKFERPVRGTSEEQSGRESTWAILMGASMLAMMLVLLVSRIGQGAAQPLVPLFVSYLGAGDASSSMAGAALGLMGVTSAVSSVVLGRLADRIGPRSILILSVCLAGVLYFPQAGAQTPLQFVLATGLFGVAVGGIMPTASSIIANLTPMERRGIIYGFSNTAMSIGAFIGPIGGTMIAAWIDMRFAFAFLGVLMLATAGWIWYALPKSLDQGRQAAPTTD